MTESELDDLYGAPPKEFVARRDELVKQLRDSGDDEQAAEIKKLRKPTAVAWALNQVARQLPDEVTRLGELHEKAARGGAKGVREAASERRFLVARLSEAATEVLDEAGHSSAGAVKDRILGTLLAAAAGEGSDLLRAGRLERELSPEGLSSLSAFAAEAPPLEEKKGPSAKDELHKELKSAEAEAARLEAEAEAARNAADAAWRKVERLRARDE